MKIKLISSLAIIVLIACGLYSFKSMDNNLNQEDAFLIMETNNLKDVDRISDLLTRENFAEVEKLAQAAFLKIKITTKNRKKDKEILIEGSSGTSKE